MSDIKDTTDYTKIPEVLAVLPLRNIVVFPGYDRAAICRERQIDTGA